MQKILGTYYFLSHIKQTHFQTQLMHRTQNDLTILVLIAQTDMTSLCKDCQPLKAN